MLPQIPLNDSQFVFVWKEVAAPGTNYADRNIALYVHGIM
jgi:hypothetical protein